MAQRLWIFGYGSLMWNPGFDPAERVIATLPGFARTFCMRSIHHRGTPEEPGLVLALDQADGAQCTGLAFAVQAGQEHEVLEYLRERELISSAYLEETHPIDLATNAQVRAVTFVVDRDHVQYCGGLPISEQAHVIAQAVGGRGPNTEYLHNTVAHLAELGIRDPDLEWLDEHVRLLTRSRE